MGIKDPHDKREFQHFVKFADDGTVAAIVEVADGQPEPDDLHQSVYIDVTHLHPFDVRDVTVPPADVGSATVAGRASRTPPPDDRPVIAPSPDAPVVISTRAQNARRALRVALETAKQARAPRG